MKCLNSPLTPLPKNFQSSMLKKFLCPFTVIMQTHSSTVERILEHLKFRGTPFSAEQHYQQVKSEIGKSMPRFTMDSHPLTSDQLTSLLEYRGESGGGVYHQALYWRN